MHNRDERFGKRQGDSAGEGRAAESLALAQHGAPQGPTWAPRGAGGVGQKGPWGSKEVPVQSSWGLERRWKMAGTRRTS